jgi:hypothetical protein
MLLNPRVEAAQAALDLFPHRQRVPHINEAKVASFYSPHFPLLHMLL